MTTNVSIKWCFRRIWICIYTIYIQKPVLFTKLQILLSRSLGTLIFSEAERSGRLYKKQRTETLERRQINPLGETISLEDLEFPPVGGSDDGHRTCGETPTSVNTPAVPWVRLVFGKAGLEIAGWAFLSRWLKLKRGSTPWACPAPGRGKGCSNVTSDPPKQPGHSAAPAEKKKLFVNVSDALRP